MTENLRIKTTLMIIIVLFILIIYLIEKKHTFRRNNLFKNYTITVTLNYKFRNT